jgi:hypothetical protein
VARSAPVSGRKIEAHSLSAAAAGKTPGSTSHFSPLCRWSSASNAASRHPFLSCSCGTSHSRCARTPPARCRNAREYHSRFSKGEDAFTARIRKMRSDDPTRRSCTARVSPSRRGDFFYRCAVAGAHLTTKGRWPTVLNRRCEIPDGMLASLFQSAESKLRSQERTGRRLNFSQ